MLEIGGEREGWEAAIDAARADRDTLGGVVEVRATGVFPGLGSYATREDRLDARLAAALMGIQAVKGVEVGDGFALARERGSAAHDEIEPGLRRRSNRAGGIEAGISNGEELVVRAAMKPLPTLMRPLDSVDLATGEPAQALVERSDVAAVEALAVVAEAAVAWELARAAREKLGGDALVDMLAAHARVPGAHPGRTHALDRHVALIGFMGAGKSTLGAALAERLGRPFVDVDREIEREQPIARIFETGGEAAFRVREAKHARDALESSDTRRDRTRRRCGRSRPDPDGAAPTGADRPRRGRPGGGLAPRRGRRPAAGAGRGGVPHPVRAAAAALRRRGERPREGPGGRRPRRRRRVRRAGSAPAARRARPR